jgi:hypothetical protein
MAKQPKEMTEAELTQEMWKREDSLDHLMARRAAKQARFNGWCMLASVIIATLAAIASACSAYFAYISAAAKLAH